MTDLVRCGWSTDDPLYVAYHDNEWGTPCYDDSDLFERLILEGFQAGLSWITILRKRQNFAAAFANWDAGRIASFGEDDVARLLADPGIIRNRLKVRGAIQNARAYLAIKSGGETFADVVWSFVGGSPIAHRPATLAEVPVFTEEAVAMSKALKKRGFTFVGPTICYAFMQSAGMVDDHVVGCFRATPV